ARAYVGLDDETSRERDVERSVRAVVPGGELHEEDVQVRDAAAQLARAADDVAAVCEERLVAPRIRPAPGLDAVRPGEQHPLAADRSDRSVLRKRRRQADLAVRLLTDRIEDLLNRHLAADVAAAPIIAAHELILGVRGGERQIPVAGDLR